MNRFLGVVVFLASTAVASATIIVTAGNDPIAGSENVLFNDPSTIAGPALMVTGTTNTAATIVNFTGEENLITPSNGAARIEAEDSLFNALTIGLAGGQPFSSFTGLQLNLNADEDGTVQFTVDQAVGPDFISPVFNINAGGENRFTITAFDGQLINTITFDSAALQDVRQIRIGFDSNGQAPGDPAAIPEPVSMSLLGSGLLAFGLYRRCKR
jgi:hypothetical protein